MGTPYSDIYDDFLNRITDYDLLQFEYEDREEILHKFMCKACTKFNNICVVDLNDRDDEDSAFNITVPDDAIDIISTGMIVEWLKPKYYFNENLKNVLNTKDYSTFSPANLLSQIRELYKDTNREFKDMIIQYSYDHADDVVNTNV